jgi:RNA polymerase primary sigma factor
LDAPIEEETALRPGGETPGASAHELSRDALDQQSRREREVIEMRLGLKDGQAHTLEETARAFGVTRDRVRQIEAQALRKLRSLPTKGRELRDPSTNAATARAD